MSTCSHLAGPRRRHLIIPLAALVASACGGPPPLPETIPHQDYSVLDEQVSYLVDEALGAEALGAIVISVHQADRGFVYERGFGAPDPDAPQTVADPAKTGFLGASTTKPLTAMAVLQLVEQGELQLSDPITDLIDELSAPADERLHDITLEHLLAHRSGLPASNFDRSIADVPLTPEELATAAAQDQLKFAPGERYAYSNIGFALLGLVVERTSGQSLADHVEEHIFAACEVQEASLDPERGPALAPAVREGKVFANGHAGRSGAGALRTSARDLASWGRVLTDGTCPGGVVLQPPSLANMRSVRRSAFDLDGGVGLGLFADPTERWGGLEVYFHDGSLLHYNALLVNVPELGLTVVAMSNEGHAPVVELGWRALTLAIETESGMRPPAAPAPATPSAPSDGPFTEEERQAMSGWYAHPLEVFHVETGAAGSLTTELGGSPLRLVPTPERTYRLEPIVGLPIPSGLVGVIPGLGDVATAELAFVPAADDHLFAAASSWGDLTPLGQRFEPSGEMFGWEEVEGRYEAEQHDGDRVVLRGARLEVHEAGFILMSVEVDGGNEKLDVTQAWLPMGPTEAIVAGQGRNLGSTVVRLDAGESGRIRMRAHGLVMERTGPL